MGLLQRSKIKKMKNFFIPISGNHLLLLFMGLILMSACGSSSESSGSDGSKESQNIAEKNISILHTNDMHGTYMPFGTTNENATAQTGDSGRDTLITFSREASIGGFAYLAAAVKKIRSKKGNDNTLLLDGGDTFGDDQLGNITKGEAMIRLMNQLGYELMALGNHDFDYGLERTRELENLATFPMRAANIVDLKTGKPIFGEAYKIFIKNGIRIGVLPLGYRNTPKTGNPDNVKDLEFQVGQEIAKKYIPEMKKEADIIIVLSHEGKTVDYKMAEEVQGIDLIIGAHSHDFIAPAKKIGSTYVVQAMSDDAVLGETILMLSGKKLVDVKVNHHWLWNDEIQPDPETQQRVNDLREPHLSRLTDPVVVSNAVIGRQYKSESPFDKLVGNLLLEGYDGEIAFMPGVGYGISLLPGPVSSEQVYKLIPHSSKIVTLKMSGEQLRNTLEQTAANLKPKNPLEAVGGLLQSSGIQYEMDLQKEERQRVNNIRISGQELQPSRLYKVVTHSGMLTGLHNYKEIGNGQDIHKTDTGLTEYIIEKLKEKKQISMPSNMGEVTIKKAQ